MPSKSLRPCGKHGCGKLTRERFCADHTACANEQRKLYDHGRDSELRKLYRIARWTRIRLRVLFRDPICKECGRAASAIVDHIIHAEKYVFQNGGNINSFFDEDNLQGLCHGCHNTKTAKGE